MNKLFYYGIIALGLLYLANLTFGVVEFLPDNLPLVGNMDEGAAGALILYAFQKLKSG